MDLLLLGVNHRTASLPEREALALDPDATARLLADLVGHGTIDEALVFPRAMHGVHVVVTTSRTPPSMCAPAWPASGRAAGGTGASLYQHSGTSASSTCSASPQASTRWLWAKRRFWAR
jgi:hypothetical protein